MTASAGVSITAQRVAAYRLGFARAPAPFGDPEAEERLARDVAGVGDFDRSERMERYLRARTAFFDRVVVGALERGVTQVVVVGAGYDGRALRYAKPGVRWFEVDHPATHADKRPVSSGSASKPATLRSWRPTSHGRGSARRSPSTAARRRRHR